MIKFRVDIFDKQPHEAKDEPLPEIPAEMVEGADGVGETVKDTGSNSENTNTPQIKEINLTCPSCKRSARSPYVTKWPIEFGNRPSLPGEEVEFLLRKLNSYIARDDLIRRAQWVEVAEAMLGEPDSGVDGESILAGMDSDTRLHFIEMARKAYGFLLAKIDSIVMDNDIRPTNKDD